MPRAFARGYISGCRNGAPCKVSDEPLLQLLVSRFLPWCYRSIGRAIIVFLTRVLHDHVGCRLESPRSDVRPVLRVSLGIVNGHRMLNGIRIRSKESGDELHIRAMRMAGGIQPGIAVEFCCFDNECVSVPMSFR